MVQLSEKKVYVMSIVFQPEHALFTLTTRNSSYQMRVGRYGHLLHLYYGRRAEGDFSYLYEPADYGFSPNPYEGRTERGRSLDTYPQEFSSGNTGDYRLNALSVAGANGVWGADLRYVRHTIAPGKYAVQGMPSAFDRGGEAETLTVTLADAATGLEVELRYAVYAEQDVITRSARLTNRGEAALRLEKAASLCLDLPFGAWDLIHFHGRHAMERQAERVPLMTGIHTVSSRRGASSHHQNPFVILCEHGATEDFGECCGLMLVYSGSHRIDIERDQLGSVRAVMGIHDEQFSWLLAPGESFDTPEVLLSYTGEGLTRLSQTFHRFLRGNLCRSRFTFARRPVLLNNWEATYFAFSAEKLLEIARQARDLGVELFVLDDGWFGARSDDNRALGDWTVNEQKLPGGLDPLIAQIKALGLQFGLWVEPEMVSEDSDLYRAHPDWALTVPGRAPTLGRNQLVLDLSRPDVVDWLYETFSALLRDHDISYIKWDMNRNISDAYGRLLPPERQGEVLHRYMLGLYDLLERLTTEFPDVLFEGCAGGGGRYDAAMLAYFPQIWCSDNTDAIERLSIQRGSSYGYPTAACGSHVSASPNHQTGRQTALGTRGVVAMAGTFGYELDPGKLSEDEKAQIRQQIARFSAYYDLIQNGDYYRLGQAGAGPAFSAWQFVASDGSETLVNLVVTHPEANPTPLHVRLKGLEANARYRLERREFFGNLVPPFQASTGEEEHPVFSGAALLYGGYSLPRLYGDYPTVQLYLKRL